MKIIIIICSFDKIVKFYERVDNSWAIYQLLIITINFIFKYILSLFYQIVVIL